MHPGDKSHFASASMAITTLASNTICPIETKSSILWDMSCQSVSTTIIEARSAMDKERRVRMEFDTDSFDILIDNCCSHTLTNDINDYIEPPVKFNLNTIFVVKKKTER